MTHQASLLAPERVEEARARAQTIVDGLDATLLGQEEPQREQTEALVNRIDELSDEKLLQLVESDEKRLVEIATQTEPPSEQELRAIANRLPMLLRELESRGTPLPGSHVRHPVIR